MQMATMLSDSVRASNWRHVLLLDVLSFAIHMALLLYMTLPLYTRAYSANEQHDRLHWSEAGDFIRVDDGCGLCLVMIYMWDYGQISTV